LTESTYKADSIQVLEGLEAVRNRYNIFDLLNQINKRGDIVKLAKSLNVDRWALGRAIDEAEILSIFPNITKAKAVSLSTLKIKRELELFSKYYDINKLEVRQLYKKVKEWRNLLEKNPRILLTEEQHDLIIGSTLGDASIRQRNKNCSFRVCHSKRQENYLNWKYNILKEFITTPIYFKSKNINNRFLETLDFSTFTHYIFNHYRKLFYKNNTKTITRELLNLLNPRSLAIWLCDDGSYDNRQGYIVICTNSFTLEEHKIIKTYFEDIWGLSPTIGFRDKKYYYLRFKQEDSRKLIKIVKPFILDSMEYKIGEKNG